MRVLVTGASGYIAASLLPAMNRTDGRLLEGSHQAIAAGRWLTLMAPDRIGGVLHLAADTRGDWHANVGCVASWVGYLASGSRFIFASSITAQHPQDQYDREKALGEAIVQTRPDITAVILRLCSVYGEPILPNKRSALNQMMSQALRGENLECYGNALAARDFVHLSDVVRAFILALDAPHGVYDVGTGLPNTLADAAAEVARQTGVRCDVSPTATAQHHPIATENHWLPGWMPKVTLVQGIARTLDWLRAQAAQEPAAAEVAA